MSRTTNNRNVQSRIRKECSAPHPKHFLFAASLRYRKRGDPASGIDFAVVLTIVNPRPRDSVLRSVGDPALRIRIRMSSIKVSSGRIMPRSHTPFLKGVLNPSVRLKVQCKFAHGDHRHSARGTTGRDLDNAECVDISLTVATEMGNDSVHSGGEQNENCHNTYI
jgi:hypothetical protein